jgi:uncharacterized membrane protein YedE/YeeE
MLVAIRSALWEELAGAIDLFGREEYLFVVVLVWLAVAGAGALSLDALMARVLRAGPASEHDARSVVAPRHEALSP